MRHCDGFSRREGPITIAIIAASLTSLAVVAQKTMGKTGKSNTRISTRRGLNDMTFDTERCQQTFPVPNTWMRANFHIRTSSNLRASPSYKPLMILKKARSTNDSALFFPISVRYSYNGKNVAEHAFASLRIKSIILSQIHLLGIFRFARPYHLGILTARDTSFRFPSTIPLPIHSSTFFTLATSLSQHGVW